MWWWDKAEGASWMGLHRHDRLIWIGGYTVIYHSVIILYVILYSNSVKGCLPYIRTQGAYILQVKVTSSPFSRRKGYRWQLIWVARWLWQLYILLSRASVFLSRFSVLPFAHPQHRAYEHALKYHQSEPSTQSLWTCPKLPPIRAINTEPMNMP